MLVNCFLIFSLKLNSLTCLFLTFQGQFDFLDINFCNDYDDILLEHYVCVEPLGSRSSNDL